MALMASLAVAKSAEWITYDAQVAALETFNSAAQGVYDRLCKTHNMLPNVLQAGFVGHRPEDINPLGVPATAARVGHW